DKRPDLEGHTLTSLLVEDVPLQDLVQPTSQADLAVVPSDTSLAGVEQVLANRIGRETILREALDTFPAAADYDFVLFDCPPSPVPAATPAPAAAPPTADEPPPLAADASA